MTKRKQIENSAPEFEAPPPNLPQGVKLVCTLRGHTDWIGRIAWSPDGRMLASPSADETIRLWDAATGESVRTLHGHQMGVNCVAFDPSGRTLVSGSSDNTIKQWASVSGQQIRSLEGHHRSVNSVAVDPQGKLVASEHSCCFGGSFERYPNHDD